MRRSRHPPTRPVRPPPDDQRPRRVGLPRRPTGVRPGTGARSATRGAAAALVALVSAVLLPACTGPDAAESTPRIDRGEFIEVMVALRDATLELEREDSVPEGRFEELRDSILSAHGVDGVELYAFVSAHPDLEYQEALWDSINRRLMRPLKAPDVTGRDSLLPDSVGRLPQPPKRGDGLERMRPDRR